MIGKIPKMFKGKQTMMKDLEVALQRVQQQASVELDDGIVASFVKTITEIEKRKRNVVIFLYLQVAVWENITIRDAFRKYAWIEQPIDKHFDYEKKDGYLQIKSAKDGEKTTISLIPRKDCLENEMPYREAALEMVDIFKEILNIND